MYPELKFIGIQENKENNSIKKFIDFIEKCNLSQASPKVNVKIVTKLTDADSLKKGNSESLADSLISKLDSKHLTSNKVLLRREIGKPDNLIELVNNSDVIILSLPVYENSVPGLVLEFFEMIYANKKNIVNKSRKMLVISNSGFAEPIANASII